MEARLDKTVRNDMHMAVEMEMLQTWSPLCFHLCHQDTLPPERQPSRVSGQLAG